MTRQTTWSEDMVLMFTSFWLLVGLCLDGWAHATRPELETFFTPWHAVFYSGFSAGAAWVAIIIMRRRPQASSFVDAIPDAYRLSIVGLGLFAIGGVSDSIWHTVLGIETGIDALLSPPHLLLLVGMLMSATAPLRKAWADPTSVYAQASLKEFLPPLLSLSFATVGVSFFHWYTNAFDNWWLTVEYVSNDQDYAAIRGILGPIVFTVVLIGAALILQRRWRTPMGSMTLLYGFVGVFMAGLDAFENWWQIIPALVGGLVFDLVIGWVNHHTWRIRLASMLSPLVMWSVSALAFEIAHGVGWPPEFLFGHIVVTALFGLGLSLLAFPPALPANVTTDQRP